MKKLSVKKLSLGKATITNLDPPQMNEVKGGYISYTCDHPDFCNTNYRCTTSCNTEAIFTCLI